MVQVRQKKKLLLKHSNSGSALLLRLYALSKPSRPASRGGSPLRQDLAAQCVLKAHPMHSNYTMIISHSLITRR